MLKVQPGESAHRPSTGAAEIERLFREHNHILLRFIAARVGSEAEAREIAQEAYVHILRLDRPEAISHLRAFLFKTAANLAVDRLRARGREPPRGDPEEAEWVIFELSPERQLAGEQMLAVVRSAVQDLPPKCRQAFLLHRIQDMSTEEVARRMRLGECMVRRYVARALEYLRLRLDAATEPDIPRHGLNRDPQGAP